MNLRLSEAVRTVFPRFWSASASRYPYLTFTGYRSMWLLTVCLLAASCLLPLIIIVVADYGAARRTIEREERLRTERLASNAERSIAHFLEERLDALAFTAHEIGVEALKNPEQMAAILSNLKQDIGGFTDLGLVDESARQVAYAGPYDLIGRDYSDQEWFSECREHGTFISEVYRGHRNEPHIVIAVGTTAPDGKYYAVRAALDTQRLVGILEPYASEEEDDVFLMSRSGIIQTPSRRNGDVLGAAQLTVPPFSEDTESFTGVDSDGLPVSIGYAYIKTANAQTPFILVLSRPRKDTIQLLSELRTNRVLIVTGSSLFILLVITVTSSFLFNRLIDADRLKGDALLSMQETSRLASLGRLSTGIAHEINNPLAVINESAGYLKDLLSMKQQRDTYDPELLEQADAILESVNRCSAITKGLLGFARDMNLHFQSVEVGDLIERVLSFHRKEAEYRDISIQVDIEDEVPEVVSDPGRLQQIFLNLIGNAFQAMDAGDSLTIAMKCPQPGMVSVEVADTGCGIPKDYLGRVFEPFFTTKGDRQGTGLGLSITYNLVQKLGGEIDVSSEVGEGTTFVVTLPVRPREEDENESLAG
jgi:signal transduction histidine kinase